jgi:hypothetical protein
MLQQSSRCDGEVSIIGGIRAYTFRSILSMQLAQRRIGTWGPHCWPVSFVCQACGTGMDWSTGCPLCSEGGFRCQGRAHAATRKSSSSASARAVEVCCILLAVSLPDWVVGGHALL